MVEQRDKVQEVTDNRWSVSIANVGELLNSKEPVERSKALSALALQYNINHSALWPLEKWLIDKKIIGQDTVTINGKVRKALSVKSLCYVGLVAQGLMDQKLLYYDNPERNNAIRELIGVIEEEGDNLC